MNNKFESASRLLIFFILAAVISGSTLAYFSINNISNLKELTEKRILEEQKEFSVRLSDAVHNKVLEITIEFNNAGSMNGVLADALLKTAARYDCINLVFILNKKGSFIFPNFAVIQENLNEPRFLKRFNRTFEIGEKAEYKSNNLKAAQDYYLSSLKLAVGKEDSAKAINALGRISLKLNDYKNGITYYNLIISDFCSQLSPYGIPYTYYAVGQLIKISDTQFSDEIFSLIKYSLNKMKNGTVPLNYYTEELLIQIREWMKDKSFKKQELLYSVSMMIENLNLQLRFLRESGPKISALVENEDLDKYLIVGDGYKAVNSFSEQELGLILVNTKIENPLGFVIDGEQLFDSIVKTADQSGLKNEYLIEFPAGYNVNYPGQNLDYSMQLNPYFPGHMILIKVKDEKLITEFITRRSWIYGIASLLFLVAMSLGVVLILRDISREKQITRLRADFISNVTHELKTPLTSIYMYAESMLLNRVKSSSKKEYISIIIKESLRLKRMINNILEFSKMEEGKSEYRFVETNLAMVLEECINEMDYWLEAEKFDLQTELDENITAKIDSDRIKQAFGNLLNNAIKYSDAIKKICIRLFKEAGNIYIEVEDQGLGIADDQLSRIFDKFYRVEQNENISGTGLGLSVVKEIVEMHHGKILVKSQPGKGSKFSIILTQ